MGVLYECKYCGLKYKSMKWALRCKKWCEKHKSCNVDVIKHAVEM